MDGQIAGYASLFGVPDLGRDVVAPGAFAASLRARGVAGVRMLWQHDPAEPVGRWLALREDARGLHAVGRLNLAVQRGRELDALMREGGLDGLSIGFRTVAARPDRAGYRHLSAIDLWEISLVTFPLQPGARAAPDGAGSLAAELRAFAQRIAPDGRPRAGSERPERAPLSLAGRGTGVGVVPRRAQRCRLHDPHPYPSPRGGGIPGRIV